MSSPRSSNDGTADPARYVKPGLASIPEEDLTEYSGNTTVCIGYITVLVMIATATALAARPGIPTLVADLWLSLGVAIGIQDTVRSGVAGVREAFLVRQYPRKHGACAIRKFQLFALPHTVAQKRAKAATVHLPVADGRTASKCESGEQQAG